MNNYSYFLVFSPYHRIKTLNENIQNSVSNYTKKIKFAKYCRVTCIDKMTFVALKMTSLRVYYSYAIMKMQDKYDRYQNLTICCKLIMFTGK